jgi:hypothetical protein
MASVTDLYGHILGFLDQSPYCFLQVDPQLYWTLFQRRSLAKLNIT